MRITGKLPVSGEMSENRAGKSHMAVGRCTHTKEHGVLREMGGARDGRARGAQEAPRAVGALPESQPGHLAANLETPHVHPNHLVSHQIFAKLGGSSKMPGHVAKIFRRFK
ncbi:unnamed protein product [Caenorhabditis angaria]|uniref:Uncharacterized protein n=1 Tax=Caenorhabditis angaria TaxID=860376 RepID=A0A9P1I9C8_9PELO|nr:unnamed protein product [Caenorhabditis angaria]